MKSFNIITFLCLFMVPSAYGQGNAVENLRQTGTQSQQLLKQQAARRDQQRFRTAQSYINHHRYAAAILILEDLVIRYPKNTSYYNLLLRSYLMISNLARADSLVNDMLRRQPNVPHYQIGKANILYRQGMEKEALQLWKNILIQNPNNLNLYSQIAQYLFKILTISIFTHKLPIP
jgi:predicted Zn-dependent protease